ncbi:MAG TPA: glycosyltransferase 61 family protein [Rhodoblastus sp.]|nr:glycosyltransferase 61 family protein [Rhodoblastus sp.]
MSAPTTPGAGAGWKQFRRTLSRAAGQVIREPLRRIREPARQFLLRLVPGFPVVIESAESLPLVPFQGALPVLGSRCRVYDDAQVAIHAHVLSRISADPGEALHYADHVVTPPGLTLESPGPHFWFSRSGVMISPRGRIWPHSFMAPFRRDRLRTVKSIRAGAEGADERGLTFHPALLRGAPRIAGAHLLVAQPESPNFGHFLLDVVPLMALGDEIGAPMLSWPLKPWQKPIVERLGLKPGLLREIPARTHLIEEPVVSNRLAGLGAHIAHPGAKQTFERIRSHVAVANFADLPRKFFLMRGMKHNRALKNRVELAETLTAHGVVAVQPEILSFDQQVALFARAELVVAEFGAALANVVFCPPGAKVLEIISEGQHDPWSSHLCGMLGLEHVVYFQPLTEEERLSRGDRFAPSPDFAYRVDVGAIGAIVDQLAAARG